MIIPPFLLTTMDNGQCLSLTVDNGIFRTFFQMNFMYVYNSNGDVCSNKTQGKLNNHFDKLIRQTRNENFRYCFDFVVKSSTIDFQNWEQSFSKLFIVRSLAPLHTLYYAL